jgi:hypothetical protein
MALIKMFAARNGDAFLIKEDSANNAAILIDGGYASTMHESILPELRDMHANGKKLGLVIATHIDADHISGLLELIKTNGKADSPTIIEIERVWHNSLRSMPGTKSSATLSPVDQDILNEIRRQGFPLSKDEAASTEEISTRQGSSLAALLLKGGYFWNNGEGRQSVDTENVREVELTNGISIRVLGPKPCRLEELRRQWLSELRCVGVTGTVSDNDLFQDAFEFLSAFESANLNSGPTEISLKNTIEQELSDVYIPDNSINNGSSISAIIETPSCRMLFLGDAWSEDIEEQIRSLPNESLPIVFDVIKVSHHGSVHNTSPSLLDVFDARIFLFSSNGNKHNHPDFPVLKAIVDRPAHFVRQLHFNYSTPASQRLRNYQPISRYKFEIYEGSTDWIKTEK